MLPDSSELIARRLGEQRLVLYALRGVPATVTDLRNHDCVTGWRHGHRPAWLLKNEQGEIEPQEIRSRHELTDGDALLHACLVGSGLAQLPT